MRPGVARPAAAPALGTAFRAPVAEPFVKWAGGKRRLVPTILGLAPPAFERYLEPFVGGGALALALGHQPMLLNDANADLMAAYQVVRDQPRRLMARLDELAAGHTPASYRAVRAWQGEALEPVERAARVIYLNKTCFNGLWRVNQRGAFNTPMGSALAPRLYDHAALLNASAALKGALLSAVDFAVFLDRQARAGDLIYLDPPYTPAGGYADFRRYTPGPFPAADDDRLVALAWEVWRRGAFPIVSGADTEETRRRWRGWRLVSVQMPRAINCRGTGRLPVNELLIVPAALGPRPRLESR